MKEREQYIDIVKGICILCIVFLHYENGILPSYVNTFIGSFMITAFYISSGWLSAMSTSKRSLKELVLKRWKQLGIPYIGWSIIILLFDSILWLLNYYDTYFMARETYKFLILRGIGTLWFLPALFGGEVIWKWLQNKHISLIIIVLLCSCIYGILYMNFNWPEGSLYKIIDAPFRTLNNILNAFVCIVAGYYSYKLLACKMNSCKKTCLFISGICLCLIAYIAANYLPEFLSWCWPYIAPIIGPVGLMMIAKAIQGYRMMDYVAYWGQNSLILMVTHYSIIMVLFQVFVEKCFHETFGGWNSIICFLLSMPLQYLIVKPVNKYAHILVGK